MESIDYQIDGSEETAVRYTEYQYDRRGQTTGYAELSQENEPTADEIKAHQIRYHYDSDGKLTKVTYPTTKNGVHALSYEYDQNGWLTKIKGEIQSEDGSTEKTVRSYTYDRYGKVKEIKDYRDLLNSSEQAVEKVYTYDSLDRVKEMTYTDLETGKVMESYQYSYDKNSNITEKTEVNNYPKEEKDKVNETKAYTYDAENRLSKVAVTDKDGKTAVIQQNRYNGDGQRIQKVEGSKTTNYYYQDGVVSYTTDGDNSQTSQNLIGTDGNILATQRYRSDHTDYLLYHKDIQGSTTSLVKGDGSADATYRYTDFGETTINGDNKAENEVCYTGGIYDQSTGLYYLNARYYNPEDGRFVTEDTYRGETNEPDTQNLYVYCADNPVNYVDPSGHWVVTLGMEKSIDYVISGGSSIQVGIDSSGRFNFSKTKYGGIKISSKFGKGKALVISAMLNMNNVKSLGGWSVKAGIHGEFLLFSVSADANINIPNNLKKNGQAGISVSGGVQKKVKKASGGVHVYLTHTKVSKTFSIKNIIKRRNYSKKLSFCKNNIEIFKNKKTKNKIGIKVKGKYTVYISSKNRLSIK